MFKIRWMCRFVLLSMKISTVSSYGDSSQVQFAIKVPQDTKMTRREVSLGCPDDQFYDAVISSCTLCSDVCKPLQTVQNFCAQNCPEYYQKNILNWKSNNSTFNLVASENQQPKDGDMTPNDPYHKRKFENHLQIISVSQNSQPQQIIERLIDKPLFWTSVLSLFIAVGASVFMVVLCVWRRRQGQRQGRRRFCRTLFVRSSSSSSDESADDDSLSKKGSSSGDSLLNSEKGVALFDSMLSIHSTVMQQHSSAQGGSVNPPGVSVTTPVPLSSCEQGDMEVDMPSISKRKPQVQQINVPELENKHRAINNVDLPVQNANIIEKIEGHTMTSSITSSLTSSLDVSTKKETSRKCDVEHIFPSIDSGKTTSTKFVIECDLSLTRNKNLCYHIPENVVTSTKLKEVQQPDEINMLPHPNGLRNNFDAENALLGYKVRLIP